MQQQNRINNPINLDLNYIDEEIRDGKHLIVQFSENTYTDEILSLLNILCEKYDKSFGIRFYGQYQRTFDCITLEKIPNVKCLYVDCLLTADNLVILTKLTKLEKLSLGIYELKDTEFLKAPNFKKLTDLTLWETKTKVFNLQYLSEYSNLNYLRLRSHTKNIFAIENLKNLNYLSLELIKNTSVSFINNLKNLKTLKFILGSRENIHEIDDNEIEHLEIIWVRGFNDISNITKFKRLKILSFENNIKLEKIDFDREMPFLKSLAISNCKTFNSLTGLGNLTSLDRIGIYQTNIDFDAFIKQDLPASLKAIRFFTGKSKLDEQIKLKIKQLGYTE